MINETLIAKIKEIITDNYYKPMFDMWLNSDADSSFEYLYLDTFKKHYGDFVTEDIECRLWFAGKNIIYAIKSFIYIKKDGYELDELLDFVEKFLSEQLVEFGDEENTYDYWNWSVLKRLL
jgi:hypothetical protein